MEELDEDILGDSPFFNMADVSSANKYRVKFQEKKKKSNEKIEI